MAGSDTICALASGPSPSAIAIIRISGPAVAGIAAALLDSGLPQPRRACLTPLRDPSGELIDQAIALYFQAPASYTGEDTLELFLHGGPAIIQHALDTLTAIEGVRLAGPGEFTRRAFEAGKLDLTQAEAVADLIEAETLGQKRQALRQASGGLSEIYAGWRGRLTDSLAALEVLIDFPDEGDTGGASYAPAQQSLDAIVTEIENALGDRGLGERIREGFRVAIIGAPNAGKSTLLNRLAGRDAAIVTPEAGTTRDLIEVRRIMGGQVVWFVDTAGLRETPDPIEAEGVRRARQAAASADLRIILIDAGAPMAPERPALDEEADTLLVYNKCDLEAGGRPGDRGLRISALTGAGVEALEQEIRQRLAGRLAGLEAPVITRARHRRALEAALAALQAARAGLASGLGAELVAEDIRLAARQLGGVIGAVDVEDVLGRIFSEFCIGK